MGRSAQIHSQPSVIEFATQIFFARCGQLYLDALKNWGMRCQDNSEVLHQLGDHSITIFFTISAIRSLMRHQSSQIVASYSNSVLDIELQLTDLIDEVYAHGSIDREVRIGAAHRLVSIVFLMLVQIREACNHIDSVIQTTWIVNSSPKRIIASQTKVMQLNRLLELS